MPLLQKIKQWYTPQLSSTLLSTPSRYRKLWRFSILITTVITIVPLSFMAAVNYFQDQKAYSAEKYNLVMQILNRTKKTLEFIIEERQSVLSFLVNEKSYQRLTDDEFLGLTLRNLKQSFGGFVDLGIIDSDGVQINYMGPYDLKGKNYKEQSWFHEVILRGVYVSDVFMGYRKFPHFVITVKQDKPLGNFFVLRATIDMELINKQFDNLELDRFTDAFLINSQGILQTPSKFYGDILQPSPFNLDRSCSDKINVSEGKFQGKRVTCGYTVIKGSPFILCASTNLEPPLKYWLVKRAELLWILSITIIIILIVIITRSTGFVNRLRASDERQAKIFHNIEYTNKMATIGRMAASVAHEINNPLAIINEKAGLLKDMVTHNPDFPRKDKFLDLLNAVEASIDRCSKVTHRLLGFSRRMDFHKELIDIEILMKEVLSFVGKETEHKNILIDCKYDDHLPTVESDRGQLQQVFLNIINNAIAAVANGGKIEIKINKIDEYNIAVSITDNGTGIPKENLKYIFEPFFSTKGEFGTGLGLSITKDIIDKLGGRIEVHSEAGKGTAFKVTLPAKPSNIMA